MVGNVELDRGLADAKGGMSGGMSGIAMHLGQRPSQRFSAAEPAVIVGDASSAALAAGIAERRAWCLEQAGGGRSVAAMQPSLHWRGRIWPLFAIDGWERAATPWWDEAWKHEAWKHEAWKDDAWKQQVPRAATRAQDAHAPASIRGSDRAAAIARLSGRLHARIQIGTGLWLLARFPDRIAPSGIEVPLVQAADFAPACRGQHVDPWRDRCVQAFRSGLAISVLGAWG
jgi:hypothetical protein